MAKVPHRIFTSIERTAAPAFSESRVRNRPDLVDEGSHVWAQYGAKLPEYAIKSP
jgi:hypothetical protein